MDKLRCAFWPKLNADARKERFMHASDTTEGILNDLA